MPHLFAKIDEGVLVVENTSARVFASEAGYGDIRVAVERILKKEGQIALFAEPVSSIEPIETRLDVEFVLDTGIFYPNQPDALVVALGIFEHIKDDSAKWRLPKKWGFWFRCKGDFDDIFISPGTYRAWKDYLARLGIPS